MQDIKLTEDGYYINTIGARTPGGESRFMIISSESINEETLADLVDWARDLMAEELPEPDKYGYRSIRQGRSIKDYSNNIKYTLSRVANSTWGTDYIRIEVNLPLEATDFSFDVTIDEIEENWGKYWEQYYGNNEETSED